MHLECLRVFTSDSAQPQETSFVTRDDGIRKWTFLPPGPGADQLLAQVAVACLARSDAPAMARSFPAVRRSLSNVRLEAIFVRQVPAEVRAHRPPRVAVGWNLTPEGGFEPLPAAQLHSRGPDLERCLPNLGRNSARWLFLGYGRQVRTQSGAASLCLGIPHLRLRRFATVFNPASRLIDPVAFLGQLNRLVGFFPHGRKRPLLEALNRELAFLFDVEVGAWLEKRYDFRSHWRRLSSERQRCAAVLLDATHHLLEASLGCPDPRDQSGVLVLNRPDAWCGPELMPQLLQAFDALFRRMQYLVVLPETRSPHVPSALKTKRLEVAKPASHPPIQRKLRLPPEAVLLLDVDSHLPNLALMKLSRHFKNQGRKVVLARWNTPVQHVGEVYASCVFAFPQSALRVNALRQRYGSALQVGGSGVDLKLRLPPEIENLAPDYTLYPELGDRALGFLSRGCPLHCPFCIVPLKEGKPRLVSDFDSLLQDGRRKLILLDDNLLSLRQAGALLEEMLRRDLQVNFNQTLDVRMLTPETAALLRRIRCSNVSFTRRNYYFSLNNTRGLDRVRDRYELLQINRDDNVEFVCMYGFDTNLADDVQRFLFLRSLPRAYVFVQRYRPVLGGPPADLTGFFDDRADEYLDQLVKIVFVQNMKSMETYYRWLCLLYAQQCRRIHPGLIDTLFRYNDRTTKGAFLRKLEHVCRAGAEKAEAD